MCACERPHTTHRDRHIIWFFYEWLCVAHLVQQKGKKKPICYGNRTRSIRNLQKEKNNNESCNSHILRPNEIKSNSLRTKRRASVQKHFRRNWIEANNKSALFLFLSASRNKNPQREGARCEASREKNQFICERFSTFQNPYGMQWVITSHKVCNTRTKNSI